MSCNVSYVVFFVATKIIRELLFLAVEVMLEDKVDDGGDDESEDDEFDVFGILADFVVELVLGDDGVEIPS